MTNKIKCSKCRRLKDSIEFSEGRKQCDKCIEYQKQYREQNRERLRLEAKEHYQNNKEKYLKETRTTEHKTKKQY